MQVGSSERSTLTVGPAADDRGYLAAAASRFSSWWSGERRSPALTADADSGAGLQGSTTVEVQPSNGDASLAPSEGGYPRTPTNRPRTLIFTTTGGSVLRHLQLY